MADAVVIGLEVAQILLQLAAAWYAYNIMKLIGTARFWILVIVAFLIQALRRMLSLMLSAGALTAHIDLITYLDQAVLPLLISLCLAVGMHELFHRLKRKL